MVTTNPTAAPSLRRRVTSTFAAASASALVLGGGLLLGAPAGADKAEEAPSLGSPARIGNGRDELALADGFELRGVPTRLSLFWSDDDAALIAETYESAWSSAGLRVEQRRMGKVTSVSALDPVSGVMRSVSIMDSGEDRLVLPNVSSGRILPDLSAAGAPVPLPEGMTAYHAHRAQDGGRASFVASYTIASPAATIAEFYRAEFKTLGYEARPESHRINDGVHTVDVSRGPETIVVTVAPASDKGADNVASFVFIDHARVLEEAP